MNKIYFVEEKSHVDGALRDMAADNQDSKIISLDPTSTHFLKTRNLPYFIPESYYTNDEMEIIRIESNKYVNKKIDEIDDYLLSTFPYLNKVKPARYHYYNFSSLLNIIPVKIAIIDKILKKEMPGEVIYFDCGIEDEADDFFVRESTWGLAISTVIENLNIKNRKIAAPVEFGVEFQDSIFLKECNKLKRRLCGEYSKKIKRKLLKLKQRLLSKKIYNKNLLFLSKSYDLEYLINEPSGLMNYAVGFYFWDLDNKVLGKIINLRNDKDFYVLEEQEKLNEFSQETSRIWGYLKGSDGFRRIFEFNSFNYFSVIQHKLERIFTKNLAEILFSDYVLPIICKKFNIQAIIANDCYSYLRQAIFYQNQRSIPAIHFYHGPFNLPTDRYWWESSEINFIFGEGVSDVARQYNPDAKYIPVGSIGIDNLPAKNKRNKKKKILYIFNNYNRNEVGFWNGTNYPENFHYYYQSRIINKLLEYPQYEILFKLHPSPRLKNPPIIEIFKNKTNQKIRIIKDAFYATELMAYADLIIIETAVGTTLLQGLKVKKPVLLFNALKFLDEQAEELIREETEYSKNIDEFIGILDRYLKNTELWTVPPQDNFLRKYGTHLNDGKSCQRAAGAIMAIINKTEDEK